MKLARLAAVVLLVSCTTLPTLPPNQSNTHQAPQTPNSSSGSGTIPKTAVSRQSNLAPLNLIDSAQGTLRQSKGKDTLSLKVIIKRPGLKTQQLELSRIHRLRAWVKGQGIGNISEPHLYNLNGYITTNPEPGEQTELQIEEVPRGRFRVVTVQGYDVDGESFPAVPGAALKAVYDSPDNSTEVRLTFTWRSTAEAEIIEAMQAAALENPTINSYLQNLDREALNDLLDALIYGDGDPQTAAYVTHPSRLDANAIADDIIAASGQIPTYSSQDPVPQDWLEQMADVNLVVRTPQNIAFSDSDIRIQITDPASIPIVLDQGDTAELPGIVPGTWDAIIAIDGPLGGVTTRTSVTVDADGNITLAKGTSDNPVILPPIIRELSTNSAPSGNQITLTGDGFDGAVLANNIVKFGDVEATVISATSTSLVVEVPGPLVGQVPITVTSNDKTSNQAPFTVTRAITSLSVPAALVGESVTINLSGYDPTEDDAVIVTFTGGQQALITAKTESSITVNVPAGAQSGPITVTPGDSEALNSPNILIDEPQITSFTPATSGVGATVIINGYNLDNVSEVKIGDVVVPSGDITQISDSVISIKVPDTAVTGPITVTTPKGSDTTDTNLEIDLAVVSLSSSSGQVNDSLTITVAGYNPSTTPTTVTFSGGVTATITASTATSITVTVPAGAQSGPITLTPQGHDPIESPNYVLNTPLITEIRNEIGQVIEYALNGQIITIIGQKFDGATEVCFGSTCTTSFTRVDNVITLTVPSGATSGPITVKTPAGNAEHEFYVVKPPTISDIDPPASNGQPMVITGNNFLSTTTVTINGQTLDTSDYRIVNDTTIELINPPTNPVNGPITVTNIAGSATYSLTYKDLINFIGNSSNAPRTEINFTSSWQPHGVNVDYSHNIYVADLNHRIFKFDRNGTLVWTAGSTSSQTLSTDSAGVALADARFNSPEDLANDADGNIYVADTSNHAIRKITTDGRVYTLARVPGPEGIEISRDGKLYVSLNDPPNPSAGANYSYVAEIADINTIPSQTELDAFSTSNAINTMSSNVRIISGNASSSGLATGTVSPAINARYQHVEGLGVDGQGRIYVADVGSNQIRRIDLTNDEVTVHATLTNSVLGVPTTYPGFPAISLMLSLHEMRVDPYGNVFFPTFFTYNYLGGNYYYPGGSNLYQITPDKQIVRVVGNNGFGLSDGNPLMQAQFQSPRGVDFAPDGTLYVAETTWGVRKITRFYPIDYLNAP